MDHSLDEGQAGPFSPMWTAQAVRQHLAGASIRGGLAGAAPRLLGSCVKVGLTIVTYKYFMVWAMASSNCLRYANLQLLTGEANHN